MNNPQAQQPEGIHLRLIGRVFFALLAMVMLFIIFHNSQSYWVKGNWVKDNSITDSSLRTQQSGVPDTGPNHTTKLISPAVIDKTNSARRDITEKSGDSPDFKQYESTIMLAEQRRLSLIQSQKGQSQFNQSLKDQHNSAQSAAARQIESEYQSLINHKNQQQEVLKQLRQKLSDSSLSAEQKAELTLNFKRQTKQYNQLVKQVVQYKMAHEAINLNGD